MRVTPDLSLEQQQKLVMTPQLRQAIAILQMSALELRECIQQELEENPLLEEKDLEEASSIEKAEDDNSDNDRNEEWLEFYNDRDIGLVGGGDEEKSWENILPKEPTLQEHLQFQLHISCHDRAELIAGNYIIGCIDANGYLSVDLEEVTAQTGVDINVADRVLSLIQSFHPHGVGARDLAECLSIQLRYQGRDDPLVARIIREHLKDLGRGRLNNVARALGISIERVQEIGDLIRTLDPRPGLQYRDPGQIKYIIPDIVVAEVEGEYLVIVNDLAVPRLMVSRLYEEMVRQAGISPDTKKYLEEKMNSAIWLMKSIEQRRMTLYNISRSLVDIQKEFFTKGIKYLKPLQYRQVAQMVNVHESTVSRAIANKYIQTPRGLFALKYFFSSGLNATSGGGQYSSRSIKKLIEELIAAEDPTQPLSDQAIEDILREKGIKISRRTVAKYRQEMEIPSKSSRKRY